MTGKTGKTGGPAFPQGKGVGEAWVFECGMTMRDAFAISALQSIISGMNRVQYHYIGAEDVASDAYELADAMLKGREK